MRFATRLRQERLQRHLSQEALAEALGVSPRSIVRWEQGKAVPHASLRLQLSHFFALSYEELFTGRETPSTSSTLWTVPFPRNPRFTGREDILQTLHKQLATTHQVALTQVSALSGLGGIGKTQVAIEYAYRHRQEYRAVFWLAAETTESLIMSLQQIAEQVQIADPQAAEQARMVKDVQRWLATHSDWLVIGDNVEDLDMLQMALPSTRQGTLLLTTRRHSLGTLIERLELPSMSNDEGMTLLLRRARQSNLPSQALALVKLLEGLPLALDQAGAYIEETGCGFEDYLQRYRDHRRQILARRGNHEGTHPASVTTTLRLAVERIEQEQSAAADLLRMCAFLHPEGIPEELFVQGTSQALAPLVADLYQFDQVVAVLRNASLVTRSPETRTLSVHRLVQAVLQDQMEPAEARLWRQRVVCMVNAAFPEETFATWERCERYLAHALACVPLVERTESNLPEAAELLYKAGSYLGARGRYGEAEGLLDQALTLGERQHGSDHPTLIPLLEKRAELFWRQEEHERTEQLLLRVLTLEEHHLGLTHPRTAETLNNLATLYQKQGKDDQAELLYQQTLHIEEQQLGPDHPEIATTLNNLAVLYRKQDKYEQAEALYQRSLSIREQQLGPDHPETAFSLNNLARLYGEQGNYEQAEPLYQRALDIREHQLGSEHPDTAATLNNLATLYREQGKYEQAEILYHRALHIWELRFGPEHPERANTLAQLATLYREQRKYEQAWPLYQQALITSEHCLGREHPRTVTIRKMYRSFLEERRNVSGAPRDERLEDENSL